MPAFIDLTGRRFFRLVVLSRAPNQGRDIMWDCLCDCGNSVTVHGSALRNGLTQSCKCYMRERITETHASHGASKTTEYTIWQNAIARCYCPTNKAFKHYGGRQIGMVDRWRYCFENFLSDMGKRPSPKHSLDRIDNNGDYGPENCRWATQSEQCRNTRSNKWYEWQGKRQLLGDWAKELGVTFDMLRGRLRKGWPLEKVLTTPKLCPSQTNKKSVHALLGSSHPTFTTQDKAKSPVFHGTPFDPPLSLA